MIRGDQVWVKGYARGPHDRAPHHVSGFTRCRPGCRQKASALQDPDALPSPESVSPCDSGPQVYRGHPVNGYWRRRPIR